MPGRSFLRPRYLIAVLLVALLGFSVLQISVTAGNYGFAAVFFGGAALIVLFYWWSRNRFLGPKRWLTPELTSTGGLWLRIACRSLPLIAVAAGYIFVLWRSGVPTPALVWLAATLPLLELSYRYWMLRRQYQTVASGYGSAGNVAHLRYTGAPDVGWRAKLFMAIPAGICVGVFAWLGI